MLKIVVYDGGMGGELFASYLKQELPVVEVVRVIDWDNKTAVLGNARQARKAAEKSLQAYFGKVDLIVFANHLLAATSLKYFRKKYAGQKFVGFQMPKIKKTTKERLLVLTTPALARTWKYRFYRIRMKRETLTLALEKMVEKIDEANFPQAVIEREIVAVAQKKKFQPKGAVLLCSQFSALACPLKKNYGVKLKIYDSYMDTLGDIYRALGLKGWVKKKK